MEWLYKSMLGIKVKGENDFEISPIIGEGVGYAKGTYNSIYGEVSVGWKESNEGVSFTINVPVNAKATFVYGEIIKELEPGKYQFNI